MNTISNIQSLIPDIASMSAPQANRQIPAAELQKLAGAEEMPRTPAVGGNQPSFAGLLDKMVTEVDNKQAAASQAVHDLRNGQNVSLHQTMIAMEEASVSFQLMVEVRNKVLESYQELMRMQV